MTEYKTLVDLLRHRSALTPDRGFTYLVDGELQEARLSFLELDRQARSVAAALQQRGLAHQRALLLFPTGIEFPAAFFGCLYAGVTAIPAPLPVASRTARLLPRIRGIFADAAPAAIVTDRSGASILEALAREDADIARVHRLVLEDLKDTASDDWREPSLSADATAHLQYTSGSTSTPRGAIITHGNLLACSSMIRRNMGFAPDGVAVMWVPPYHDDGLVQGLIQPVFSGVSCVLLSPFDFIARPERWLEAITRYRATNAGGPNFAFELALRKVPDDALARLDLSSWRYAYNAAEHVRWETLTRFYERFRSCGLRWEALGPCYGLAEATLVVTATPPGAGPGHLVVDADLLEREGRIVEVGAGHPSARALASSGPPVEHTRVVIAARDSGRICRDDEVGEILVRNAAVAGGYLGRIEESRATFGARLEDGSGPYLRTGDLGFLHGGALYVTGRCKDLIIIGGENRYPQDIEWTVQACHPSIHPGCVAAFSVHDGLEERLCIVAEAAPISPEEREAIFDAILLAVAAEHELKVDAIVLIRPGTIPKTSSGKLQRGACRQRYLEHELRETGRWVLQSGQETTVPGIDAEPGSSGAPVGPTKDVGSRGRGEAQSEDVQREARALERWLLDWLAEQLEIQVDRLEPEQPFARYGLDSATAVRMAEALGERLRRRLEPTLAWEFPTVRALTRHLSGQAKRSRAFSTARRPASEFEPIAIVGMGCRFPGGASSPEAFWRLLCAGEDAIGEVPPERWSLEAWYDPDPKAPGKMNTRRGGFLLEVDRFDAEFFGIAPREAVTMDPQQRLLLEVCWEALESAGTVPEQLKGSRTGVYVGLCTHDYEVVARRAGALDAYTVTGLSSSPAAGRVSYTFGFQGPALVVDTACSSSLVAVHLAAQALRAGECDAALAGGVNLILSPENTVSLSQFHALSPAGRCRPFSAEADGYVRSEGCGMVMLKRLSDARRDGDRVLALVRGTAINQDGRSNGLTAPSGAAQEEVVKTALERSGLEGHALDYVECHGTGTPLGDPIEVQALARAVGAGRDAHHPVRLGSVKANIGHTEAAAGIAGLIKATLALQHGMLPGTPDGLGELNPRIPWQALLVKVMDGPIPWPRQARVRRAGVSSFGLSGTNAHVVLEEPPIDAVASAEALSPSTTRPCLLPLSGAGEAALLEQASRLRDHLASHADQVPENIAFSLAATRTHFVSRAVVVGETREMLRTALEALSSGRSDPRLVRGEARIEGGLAFIFPGLGTPWPGMARELLETSPAFRSALYACDQALVSHLGWSVLAYLRKDEGARWIERPDMAPPLSFAVMVSLAALWRAHGIEPGAVVGHGPGEVAAACVAGALTLEDAARVVALCSRALVQQEDNASIRKALLEGLKDVQPGTATLPLYLEPGRLSGLELDAGYWERALRQPARIEEVLTGLVNEGHRFFVEVSPHPVLSTALRATLEAARVKGVVVGTLHRGEEGLERFLLNLGELYTRGLELDWRRIQPGGRRVDLPTYAFQRKRYWIEVQERPGAPGIDQGRGKVDYPYRGELISLGGRETVVSSRTLSLSSASWLEDHRVIDRILFPATAIMELVLSIAREIKPHQAVRLEEMLFSTPLVLTPEERLDVQVIVDGDMESGSPFQVYSRVTGSGPTWTEHSSGRLRVSAADASPTNFPTPPGDWPPAGVEPIGISDFYDRLEARGLHYGPGFRGLAAAWRGPGGEVYGEVALPVCVTDAAAFLVHPALLDAALHALLLADGFAGWGEDDAVPVPFLLKGIRVGRLEGARLRVRVRADGKNAALEAWDARGQRVVEIESLELRRVSRAASPRNAGHELEPMARLSEAETVHLGSLTAGERERFLQELILAEASAVLGMASSQTIEPERNLLELGLDSLTALELHLRLEARTGLELPATLVLDHSTPAELVAYLAARLEGG